MPTIVLDENRLAEHTGLCLRAIGSGGVVIVPTDTVYGIVCDAQHEGAKRRIYELKGRGFEKPLIGLVGNIDAAKRYAVVNEPTSRILARAWPGAVTFLLRAHRDIPMMTSRSGEIGLRIPCHPFLLACLSESGALASTSANLSGQPAARSIQEIPDALRDAVALCVDGGRTPGRESAIWRLTDGHPRLVRGTVLFVCEGNTCRSQIAEHLLRRRLPSSSQIKVASAGLLASAGEPLPRLTAEALAEKGIDAHGSAATPLTERLAREADLVFVMTEDQKQRMELLFPFLTEKVAPVTVLQVDDPAGGDIFRYRQIRDILTQRIEETVLRSVAL